MADSTRIPGEQVKCHECGNVWPREQGGLQCPHCESEFVEIISDSSPPSPDLPTQPDSFDDMRLTRTRSLDSLEHHNPWQEAPDPDEDDIGGFPFGATHPQPRGYHWESRSPNGSSSFSFSMYSSNGGPMRVTTNRARGNEQPGDPAVMEVQNDFEDLVQTILGVTPQRRSQNRGMRPGGPPPPGFPLGSAGQPQPPGHGDSPFMGLFGTILQGLGGVRVQGGVDGNGGPFTMLQRMMDPANAAHGDAVFTQEALDRVITQIMEQSQSNNAPGPASEAAIRSLPKKRVEKEMLDDRGKAECSICMDSVEIGDQVTVLPCTHWFHEICITAWLKEHDTCPHCRKGITTQPEANGSASAGSTQPSRPPPRRRSSAAMPGSWRESPGTAATPVIVEETPSGPQDIRAARQRYYSSRDPEDMERRDTQGRRSSRSTPSSSSSSGRRHRSGSHRSNSNSNSNNGGGLGGWVRSLGGGDR